MAGNVQRVFIVDSINNTQGGCTQRVKVENAIDLTQVTGYDKTQTQTLKNVEGTLTWVDDE